MTTMNLARVLRGIAVILVLLTAIISAMIYFSPTKSEWVEEMHKESKFVSFPRGFLYFKMDFVIKEMVRGNITFFQERVESFVLAPQCYVLTTDGYNGRTSNPDWLSQAVYVCGPSLFYEPLQYGGGKYVRYFSFRANATEYYFVLIFTREPGSGILHLSRLKTETVFPIKALTEVVIVTGVLSAVLSLLSFSLGRRKRKH